MIAPEIKPEIQKYEIFEEIGHGGMATVYRALDRRLGREVAVKVIHRHLRENKEVAARFVSEARAVAKVRHPNIVEVYDVSDEDDPERYLVVELVRGITLRRLLSDRSALPAEVAAAVGVMVADGLHHAHQQGVIHRDVKPENVLIGHVARGESSPEATRALEGKDRERSARVKITDFGIAKLLDAQGVTSTGQVLGSPAHMAPEQIEGGEVGATADVFALGVLLYEAMVGRLPFEGKNPAQVLRRVLDGQFVLPERARPSIGPDFSRIVAKALAHKAEDRYASAAELGADLRAALETVGFSDAELELSQYLAAPEAYEAVYVQRVVTKLIELGNVARRERNLPAAAACFNRALAVRPEDPDLVREVAGLARMERLRKNAGTALWATAAAVLVALAAFGVVRFVNAQAKKEERRSAAVKVQPKQETNRRNPTTRLAPSSTAIQRNPLPHGSVRHSPTQRAPSVTRTVQVIIDGPKSAHVKVDDAELKDWLQTRLELSVGQHRFEFSPPDETCCVGPQRKTVEIVAGSGVQVVQGVISYRDAVIDFNAPPGAEATCGTFGHIKASGRRSIHMNLPERTERCTVIPPPESGQPPREIKVTLAPGGTFTLNWP